MTYKRYYYILLLEYKKWQLTVYISWNEHLQFMHHVENTSKTTQRLKVILCIRFSSFWKKFLSQVRIWHSSSPFCEECGAVSVCLADLYITAECKFRCAGSYGLVCHLPAWDHALRSSSYGECSHWLMGYTFFFHPTLVSQSADMNRWVENVMTHCKYNLQLLIDISFMRY